MSFIDHFGSCPANSAINLPNCEPRSDACSRVRLKLAWLCLRRVHSGSRASQSAAIACLRPFFTFPGVGETKHGSLTGGGPASSLRRRLFTTKLLLGCARNSPSAARLSPTQPPAHLAHSFSRPPVFQRGDELIIRRVARSVFTSPFSHGSAHLGPLSS